MTKPDWCLQRVWDEAVAAYEAMPLMYDGWDETEVVSCIARAILAAEKREREACELAAAEVRRNYSRAPWTSYEEQQYSDGGSSAATQIATAIRKRNGE